MNNVTNNPDSNDDISETQSGDLGDGATPQTTADLAAQEAVKALRSKVDELPPEQHEEVHSMIDEIEALLEKGPEPLSTPRTMIMELVTYWPDAVPWLTSQASIIIKGLGVG